MVNFESPQQLVKDVANLFSAPAGAAQTNVTSRTRQGFVEKSNVSSVAEMSRMIEITRTYTQISAILQQQGELRKTSLTNWLTCRTKGIRFHARTTYSSYGNGRPGIERPGHFQQHRKHAHDRLQEAACSIPAPIITTCAVSAHRPPIKAQSCRSVSTLAVASKPLVRHA